MPDYAARTPAAPVLIDDDAALDRYLADSERDAYRTNRVQAGVDLATWLASGDDACETSYAQAQRLGGARHAADHPGRDFACT